MLLAAWEAVFAKDYVQPHVATATTTRSLLLPYDVLHRADPNLADHLLTKPTNILFTAERALEGKTGQRLHLRVVAVGNAVPISKLRAEHNGRLISVEGLVKRASEVRPRVEDALFKCLRCDALIQEAQDEHLVLKEPLQCYEDQGGCGHSSGFKLMTEKSRFVDSQALEIQESPEMLRGGDVPQRLSAMAEDDISGLLRPGDRVTVTGILRLHAKKRGSTKSTLFERHLQVVSVEVRQQAYEDLNVTPEDEAQIRELAARPDILEVLTASVAPSLYGLEAEKRAVALQLFGGVRRVNPDGTAVRGDIHIGLLGDPGIAKSQVLRYAARLSPRGYYADGPGSSGAGLTAAAVKDDATDGRWTYEAGAMVLAHGGLCAVDEVDKMDDDDRDRILTAMEQGVVIVKKAGVDVELPAQCSLLVAGNPKDGRFDLKYAAVSEQIDLPAPFLSRLDLLFIMLDRVDEARDRATMEHIIFQGAKTPPISSELLRKYVAFARRTVDPELSPAAGRAIVEYYVDLRRKKADPEKVVVSGTPREGEALRRLSQAAARVRLSAVVEERDVAVATELMDQCLERMDWDRDKVIAGMGATQRDAVHVLRQLVLDHEREHDHGAREDDVLRVAWEKHGIPERRVRELLEADPSLYQPRTGFYKRRSGA